MNGTTTQDQIALPASATHPPPCTDVVSAFDTPSHDFIIINTHTLSLL